MSEPTVTRAEAIEVVDLSDLDMLDDDTRHARCNVCDPGLTLGVPFTAMCGKRAVWLYSIPPRWTPPNACLVCAQNLKGPCPKGPKGHRSC